MSNEPLDDRTEDAYQMIKTATDVLARQLLAQLGESPEAIRGAGLVVAMLGNALARTEDADPGLTMSFVLSTLVSCAEVLGTQP